MFSFKETTQDLQTIWALKGLSCATDKILALNTLGTIICTFLDHYKKKDVQAHNY